MRFKGVCQKNMAQNGVPAEKYGVYLGRTHSVWGKSLSYHMPMRQILTHLIKPKLPQATTQA